MKKYQEKRKQKKQIINERKIDIRNLKKSKNK